MVKYYVTGALDAGAGTMAGTTAATYARGGALVGAGRVKGSVGWLAGRSYAPRWAFRWPLFRRYLPFRPSSDQPKPFLTALANAFKNALGLAVTCVDEVYADAFIASAAGEGLDNWGVPLTTARVPSEADDAYRGRLLARRQEAGTGLTVAAVRQAVDDLGATYEPPLAVAAVKMYYRNPFPWDGDRDPWGAFGGRGGLWSLLDLFTGHLELSRIPTPQETVEMENAIAAVKPGLARVRLVTPAPTRGLTAYPPGYVLRREIYNGRLETKARNILSDDFQDADHVPEHYTPVGPADWTVEEDLPKGDKVLQGAGDGSSLSLYVHNAAAGDDLYAAFHLKALTAATGAAAGLAARMNAGADQDGDYYLLLIRRGASAWQWGIVWRSGGVDTTVRAWEDLTFDPTAWFKVQWWLEGDTMTVKLNGALVAAAFAAGGHATGPGGLVFAVNGVDARFNAATIW